MTFVLIALVYVAVLTVGAIIHTARDGRGPGRPPASHYEDPRFSSPSNGWPGR